MTVIFEKLTIRSQPSATLYHLPDEILQHILLYCPPQDVILSIQRVSKKFKRLGSEGLLWRYHCRWDFKYWDARHNIERKFSSAAGAVDWRALYVHRKTVDLQTTELLDSILAGQTNRIYKFKSIANFGYDAKDTLLRHCRTSETAEDVLSRRYYANAVLDHVHRSKALAEWTKLIEGEEVPLERALGCFDLFVLHDQHGDLFEISELFDNLASRLRLEYPGIDQEPTRKRALSTVEFLRRYDLTGMSSEVAYRDLQNNYIGIAIQDPDHPSLPLISVAIFCALAKRVGLDARCCGIPNHVHAMVYPVEREDLDGRHLSIDATPADPMYLDPYRSHEEVPLHSLRIMLAEWGLRSNQFSELLSDASVVSVVLRTSRNILATVQEFRAQAGSPNNNGHPTIRLHANPYADLDNAFYSALWANYIFGSRLSPADGTHQRQFVPLIQERFERLFPVDASLIEEYICPLYDESADQSESWGLREAVRVVKIADQTPKQIRLRDTDGARNGVKFKVGQVFRHRRYAYTGVITGWDMECGMTSAWIAHNHVDSLSRGRHQSFYHVLTSSVEDTTIRYVAEENIEIIEPEVPYSLMSLAGRFFKRWDQERKVFVSNLRDEYPED